jgi:hypothetical protein
MKIYMHPPTKYVDANKYPDAVEDFKEMGIPTEGIKAVDMNYAAVPTHLTQADKESKENLIEAHRANMARFGYDIDE